MKKFLNILYVIARAVFFTSLGTALGIIIGYILLGTWNIWGWIRW